MCFKAAPAYACLACQLIGFLEYQYTLYVLYVGNINIDGPTDATPCSLPFVISWIAKKQ